MCHNDELSGFNDWFAIFEGFATYPSELHGFVVAILSRHAPPKDAQKWVDLLELFSMGELSDEMRAHLHIVAQDVHYLFADGDGLEFAPMIGDDSHALDIRKRQLKAWTAGFISGLGVAGVKFNDDDMSILQMLNQIAALRVDTPTINDADNADAHDNIASDIDDFDAQVLASLHEEIEAQALDFDALDDSHEEAGYYELYELARLAPLHFDKVQKQPFEKIALFGAH